MMKVTRPLTRQHASGRAAGARALARCAATLIAICVCGGFAAGSAVAEPNSAGFGPSPGPLQSRCAALVVSSHLAFDGKELTAHAGPAQPDACGGGKVTWTWGVASGVRGCRPDGTTCTFRVSASTADTWQQVCIDGGSTQGGFESCDYFGVPAKGTGVIDGYVRDKDGGPVVGADVTAYGAGYGRRGAGAATGADGFYAIQVRAGSYSVIPSGGPHGKSEPSYDPSVVHAEVKSGSTEKADFKLKAGIELKLTFAKDTVAADGLQVLDGTVTTTEFGKPAANVQVRLDPFPGARSSEAGTTTPRATICLAGGRVWPTGTIADPDYAPVNVTTDASGKYSFALTVGTTPGTWRLDAWAYSTDGTLSSDTTAASETRSVTFTAVGSGALANFAGELDVVARATNGLGGTSGQPGDLAPTLAQITAVGGATGTLGGYAYSLVNARDGQSLLVSPVAHAPALARSGEVMTGSDLVLDPSEWTGQGLSFTNAGSLAYAIQSGQLPDLPTVAQIDGGVSVPGWTAASRNEITPVSTGFQYLGWAYPTPAVGACS